MVRPLVPKFHLDENEDEDEDGGGGAMSRREGRDSDSKHHRSRFDREPRYMPSASYRVCACIHICIDYMYLFV